MHSVLLLKLELREAITVISSTDIWRDFFEKYYRDEINKIAGKVITRERAELYIDVTNDLQIYQGGTLAEELYNNPSCVIQHACEGLKRVENIYDVEINCAIRFINLPATRKVEIRDIRTQHAGKFVSLQGIVKKVSKVYGRTVRAAFQCINCGKLIHVECDYNKVRRPVKCKCGSKRFSRIEELDDTIDYQHIELQEFPELAKSMPSSITVDLKGSLVGTAYPGNRVTINGIVRRVGKPDSVLSEFMIEANSVEKLTSNDEIEFTEDDIDKLKEIARDPDIYTKIVKSIAPTIYGYDDIKLAIALQLFGGIRKKLPDGTEIRGDIHILLVGDPGVAKSQLLRYVHRVAPRSVYTTGKGTTTAGLTAITVKDGVDGKWTLEAGALVLADRGVALVDEIDKMRSEDRSALHEAMEQQTVTVTKAGINATLNARCALLGAANPKYGRFDRYRPIAEQIDLPPTLISRFDLIFVMTDEPNEERDARLTKHILRTHRIGEKLERLKNATTSKYDKKALDDEIKELEPAIGPEILRKYILYAKNKVFPVLTDEANKRLQEFFLSVRRKVNEDSPVPITARQLEALIRLAEASARLRLSDHITAEDADRVISLVRRSLEQIGVDPETGQIDIDYVYSGISRSQRDRIVTVLSIIQEYQNESVWGAPEELILEKAEEQGIDRGRTREILEKLRERGDVYTPKEGYYRSLR